MPPSLAFITGVCKSDKRAYFTMAGARAAVKRMKSKGGKGLHAYACTFCDYFHVGHLPDGVIAGRITKQDAFPSKENRAS